MQPIMIFCWKVPPALRIHNQSQHPWRCRGGFLLVVISAFQTCSRAFGCCLFAEITILQRSRTNRVCVGVCVCREREMMRDDLYKEINYKEVAHLLLEAEKSRPRRTDGRASVWIQVWRQEETSVPAQRQAGRGKEFFLSLYSIQVFSRRNEAHSPGEGRLAVFRQLIQMLILSRDRFMETPRNNV